MKKIVFCFLIVILYLVSFSQEEIPIVFVHGISAGHEKWREIAKKYNPDNYWEMKSGENGTIIDNYIIENKDKRKGREIWNISYYTSNIIDEGLNGTLERYAHRLERMIERIKFYSGKNQVIIIAHSMGGLISRRYMTMNYENYNSVYKIVTVATPHEGIDTIPPLVNGQLRDMMKGSNFIKRLNKEWFRYEKIREKWGVIGAIDSKNILNKKITGESTDSAGIGYVTISSAIPFGEWERIYTKKEEVVYDSKYFGFAVIVNDNHNDILYNPIINEAIEWAKN